MKIAQYFMKIIKYPLKLLFDLTAFISSFIVLIFPLGLLGGSFSFFSQWVFRDKHRPRTSSIISGEVGLHQSSKRRRMAEWHYTVVKSVAWVWARWPVATAAKSLSTTASKPMMARRFLFPDAPTGTARWSRRSGPAYGCHPGTAPPQRIDPLDMSN